MAKIVGIDLGTTFSAIAHIDKFGKPAIIKDDDGLDLTPSVVQFGNPIAVGKAAALSALANRERTVIRVKSQMGNAEFFHPFDGKDYSAAEISALILKKLKQDAEKRLRMEGEIPKNEDITGACITVPVDFQDLERNATKDAAKIAGFKEVTLIDEPIASAYACLDSLSKDQTVLVADLGGGTCDVTLLKISDTKIEVVSKNGDRKLGGMHWDKAIVDLVLAKFQKQHKITVSSLADLQELTRAVVDAKEALSTVGDTGVNFQHANKSISVSLTRQDFEELTKIAVERYKAQCKLALQKAKMEWDDVDTVLMVGGSTRMPMIQKAITELSGKEIDLPKVDIDTAVALGAAIRGEDLLNPSQRAANRPKTELINVASKALGVVVIHHSMRNKHVVDLIIPQGAKIPCDREKDYRPADAAQELVDIAIVQGLANKEEIDITKLDKNPHLVGRSTLKLPQNVRLDDIIKVTIKYNSEELVEVEARGPDGRTETLTIDRPGLGPEEVKEAAGFLRRKEVV